MLGTRSGAAVRRYITYLYRYDYIISTHLLCRGESVKSAPPGWGLWYWETECRRKTLVTDGRTNFRGTGNGTMLVGAAAVAIGSACTTMQTGGCRFSPPVPEHARCIPPDLAVIIMEFIIPQRQQALTSRPRAARHTPVVTTVGNATPTINAGTISRRIDQNNFLRMVILARKTCASTVRACFFSGPACGGSQRCN